MLVLDAKSIKSEKQPLLVDFYADWCAPCRAMAKTLDKLETEYADITFGKLDIDAYPSVADDHDVRSIPTLILFRKGKEVGRLIGAVPAKQIRELLNRSSE